MEDLNTIPWNVVAISVWHKLADKLDPETSIIGNNWKLLAEKLGFTTENILNIDARHALHGRNTIKLFEDYHKRNGNSVGAVKKALEEMERPDAVEVLDNNMKDIIDSYRQNKNNLDRNNRHPEQNSCYESSQHCCSLGFPPQSLPTTAHCQASCYRFRNDDVCMSLNCSSTVYNDLSRSKDTAISRSSNQTKDYNVRASSFSNNCRSPSEPYPSLRMTENLSKVVHVDHREAYTSEEMDISDNYDVREDGQPLAAAIQRDQHYRNIAKKPCLSIADRMDEEGQDLSMPKRNDLRLHIPRTNALQTHDIISPSPSPVAGSKTPLPLAQLNQFTNSDVYMPGTIYTAMMTEKNQREFEQGRRGQIKDPNFKVPIASENNKLNNHGNGRMLDFHVNGQQSAIRRVESEMPRTFPLRNKEFNYPSLPIKERPSLLKSSISVPSDMKPAEYRKAFKHIKVFVTYAGDSKRHIQRVLNLCRCLEKNGFTCCMDMFDKRMEIANRQDWCAQRFNEADFILMCVSPQYKTEVDLYDCNNIIDDKELHIQYIYSLMLAEHEQNGHRNCKIIPLLFEGSDNGHIPRWLRNSFFYSWPNQYRDLLWCLTKPHTRIKPRSLYPASPGDGLCLSSETA